jgi:hypothetical protein
MPKPLHVSKQSKSQGKKRAPKTISKRFEHADQPELGFSDAFSKPDSLLAEDGEEESGVPLGLL